jgi:hypothetical protein
VFIKLKVEQPTGSKIATGCNRRFPFLAAEVKGQLFDIIKENTLFDILWKQPVAMFTILHELNE